MNTSRKTRLRIFTFALICVVLLMAPLGALAGPLGGALLSGPWWDVEPEEENPSQYYDSILYSEIAPRLREIEVNSNRVKVDVIGQSAGGRDLFLVTLSAPEAMGRLGQYQAISNTMLKDPDKAQEMIEKFGDFKVPVFINGSIHGGEYPGTDAAIRLIETLAYDDSEEVQAILENVILLVNVVQNPDGRVMGTRSNANGIDLNRDFFTQSQPETRATVKVFTEWNPMVVLDLHGFVTPMLIEPCTPPHNPNYEYDLYIKWALAQAEAMETELFEQTGLDAQIPFRDFPLGWDDWPPSYTPMYAMYHGAFGHTLETPDRRLGETTVDAHYAAVWGALNFIVENREPMIHDMVEIYRRGDLALPQQLIPPEILAKTPWDQFNELTVQEFPAAYVIPAGEPFQVSPHQPARLVDFLLFNDVEVEQASKEFTLDGVVYPKGTYVVWMDQPKRGLANVVLDAGLDLSDIPGLFFYSPPSVWSHPFLWGTFRAVMEEKMDIATQTVTKADAPKGSSEGGSAGAYAYYLTNIAAIQATNALLERGEVIYQASGSFSDSGRDFGAGLIILPPDPALANELANQHALKVFKLSVVPGDAVLMREQKIVAYVDSGGQDLLRRFGFEFDSISWRDLNDGVDLTAYDVFINNGIYHGYWRLNDTGRDALFAFFDAGRDYIGLGDYGAYLADEMELMEFSVDFPPGNSIVQVDYDTESALTTGFKGQGYVFINYAALFYDLGEDVEVFASIVDREDFLLSGFWPGWQTSGAAGTPVGIFQAEETQDTTLIGFDPTFRSHPEETFRMVGNAIYNGID